MNYIILTPLEFDRRHLLLQVALVDDNLEVRQIESRLELFVLTELGAQRKPQQPQFHRLQLSQSCILQHLLLRILNEFFWAKCYVRAQFLRFDNCRLGYFYFWQEAIDNFEASLHLMQRLLLRSHLEE